MSRRFDSLLQAAGDAASTESWREALVLVADTALLCRAWLDEMTPAWTASDLLAMTKLVMERESQVTSRRREEQQRGTS